MEIDSLRGDRVVFHIAAVFHGQDLWLVRYQRFCIIRTQGDSEKQEKRRMNLRNARKSRLLNYCIIICDVCASLYVYVSLNVNGSFVYSF